MSILQKIKKKTKKKINKIANGKTAFFLEEYFYRMPNPFTKKYNFCSPTQNDKRLALELEKNGIVFLRNHFSGERLKKLQDEFNRTINKIESLKEEDIIKIQCPTTHYGATDINKITYHCSKGNFTTCGDVFEFSEVFLEASLDDTIRSIASEWIGKKMFLQNSVAARYYPREPKNFGSFQWHHDTHGRKFHAMILLTDVDENEQRMSYLKGSHKQYRTREDCAQNSRISEEKAQAEIDAGFSRIECAGKAGDVVIIDANGTHRGNRNMSRIRDSIIVQYNAGRYQWSFDIPDDIKAKIRLSDDQKKFFERGVKVNWINKSKF